MPQTPRATGLHADQGPHRPRHEDLAVADPSQRLRFAVFVAHHGEGNPSLLTRVVGGAIRAGSRDNASAVALFC